MVIPTLILTGLMTIPYIDPNPRGNGYYTFRERRYEIPIFLFGFLILWILMVFQGTFLRGPNFNFYGPTSTGTSTKSCRSPTCSFPNTSTPGGSV